MHLPDGSHVVRVCSFSALGPNGEVTADCFVPHPGTDHRPADRYLSVHWLEYLGVGNHAESLARLRAYLRNSPVASEYRPTAKGRLAVLSCDAVLASAMDDVQVEFAFRHQPRLPNVATSIEVSADGQLTVGVAQQQATAEGLALDPHSGLFTLPEAAAHQLAVQQFLASKATYTEPGILQAAAA